MGEGCVCVCVQGDGLGQTQAQAPALHMGHLLNHSGTCAIMSSLLSSSMCFSYWHVEHLDRHPV